MSDLASKDPKISIIVPIYNVEQYLNKCLDSLINQTYQNIEILLIDDGSTDNSGKICDQYQKNPRVRVIHNHNQGVSATRNEGMLLSNGEYMMFVDGDDWIDYNLCEILISEVNKKKYDLIFWSYVREYPQKSLERYVLNGRERKEYAGMSLQKLKRRFFGPLGPELAYPEQLDTLSSVCVKLYRSALIKGKCYFSDVKDLGTGEDLLFNLHAIRYVQSALYLPICAYHYRKFNMASICSTYKEKLWDNHKILFALIQTMIEAESNVDYYEAFKNRIALDFVGQGLNLVLSDLSFRNKLYKIKEIFSDIEYQLAIKQLNIKFLPFHWKVFFVCVKYRFSAGVLLLCYIINYMRKKI